MLFSGGRGEEGVLVQHSSRRVQDIEKTKEHDDDDKQESDWTIEDDPGEEVVSREIINQSYFCN